VLAHNERSGDRDDRGGQVGGRERTAHARVAAEDGGGALPLEDVAHVAATRLRPAAPWHASE
jgi:hypothetical protein